MKKGILFCLLIVASVVFVACGEDSGSPNNASSVEFVLGTMVDERDGQIYKTVTIGSQTWMAQNLNYQTANSFCYNDNITNCTKYGRLYTWNAAHSACPTGWFLPTKFQWEALINAIGDSSTAGTELKSTSGWKNVVSFQSEPSIWVDESTAWVNVDNGTDAISFSALPAGIRNTTWEISDGYYEYEGVTAGFWSSTEAGEKPFQKSTGPFLSIGKLSLYWYLRLNGSQNAYFKEASLHNGYSVRCLKKYDPVKTVESSSSSVAKSNSSVKSSSSSVAKSSSSQKTVSSSSIKVVDPTEVIVDSMTDSRDSQTYKTVKIGDQTWMAQNLNYESENSYCYNDDPANCSKYGRLYTWAAAMDSAGIWSTNGKGCGVESLECFPTDPVRGVCPKGWHLPNNAEWDALLSFVGFSAYYDDIFEEVVYSADAAVLASASDRDYDDSECISTDEFSFSALPAGILEHFGRYYGEGEVTYFWSSTPFDDYEAYGLDIEGCYTILMKFHRDKGFSVRCLKDDESARSVRSSSSVKATSSSVAKSSSSQKTVLSSSDKVSELAEVTAGSVMDFRDGQTYRTVKIGDQTWMAENLNYQTPKSYCYNNSAENCEKYGRLYLWSAAMDSAGTWSTNGKGCGSNKTCSPTYPVRGICPSGWHLPTDAEWRILWSAAGGQWTAGSNLKSTSGWYNNGNGTDAFLFSALPAGDRDNDGGYYYESNTANFWSSTDGSRDKNKAFCMFLGYNGGDAQTGFSDKGYGYSVRCLKD